MEKVCVCHECGRTIESAFFYCPWCGVAVRPVPAIAGKVDEVVDRLEQIQKKHAVTRISQMEDELGEIETALSSLLAGAVHAS